MNFLLADDHSFVRIGLSAIIKNLINHCTIHEASDGKEALELYYKHHFDLLILDFQMPTLNGYDVAREILSVNSTRKIIVVSMFTETSLVSSLYQLGVKGFVPKSSSIPEFQTAIQEVLNGNLYYNSSAEFSSILSGGDVNAKIVTFNERERELVQLISKGKKSAEIAITLGLSLKTIEANRTRLMEKTGVVNMASLVDYFYRNGQL